MFDTHSDFALNKKDKTAIVYQSSVGNGIRLTCEDFASEEEFNRWKEWPDKDYHEMELAGRASDSYVSLESQRDGPTPSAEDIVLAPYITAEQKERRFRMLEQVKSQLTEKQYRRLCLYYLDGKTEREIAQPEGVGQQRISTSIIRGVRIVERFFQDFLKDRG